MNIGMSIADEKKFTKVDVVVTPSSSKRYGSAFRMKGRSFA